MDSQWQIALNQSVHRLLHYHSGLNSSAALTSFKHFQDVDRKEEFPPLFLFPQNNQLDIFKLELQFSTRKQDTGLVIKLIFWCYQAIVAKVKHIFYIHPSAFDRFPRLK